jgi:hypothetical protein
MPWPNLIGSRNALSVSKTLASIPTLAPSPTKRKHPYICATSAPTNLSTTFSSSAPKKGKNSFGFEAQKRKEEEIRLKNERHELKKQA